MKFWVLSFLSLFCIITGYSQTIPHQYLVEWSKTSSLGRDKPKGLIPDEYFHTTIDAYSSIRQVRFPEYFSEAEEIQALQKDPRILNYQKNTLLAPRGCNPNDPGYVGQWNLERMKFDEIWCFTNEGVSPLGDTLVVGIMDFGYDFKLSELINNVFVNRGEIPGNSLDDDNNGYVDDYYGYSPISSKRNDEHPKVNHGTEVFSVAAAQGNNGKGISGASQAIKMLICSGNNDAHMVECYTYFYRMRELYQKTAGKQGAYVVATTISLGYDTSFPEEFPLICPLYDWLGSLGIINVCATVNKPDHDVALKGDVPSLCPSPFLISVTNTDYSDRKVSAAGFSKIHIDLGASGEEIPVIQTGGTLGSSGGCSLSAPQVAAGIGLLNQFCPKYAELVKNKPLEALGLMRSFVLDCGDENPSLKDITSSGRRFNVQKSWTCLEKYCNSLTDKTYMEIVPNPVKEGLLRVKLGFDKFGDYELKIIDVLGRTIHTIQDSHLPGNSNLEITVNSTNWPSGTYYIQFKAKEFESNQAFIKY